MDRKQVIVIGMVGFLCIVIIGIALRYMVFDTVETNEQVVQISEASHAYDATVTIEKYSLSVAVADTPAKKSKGLGGVRKLGDDEGMLFPFENSPYAPSFWMKGMMIAIDIIWIQDNIIVAIDRNVPAQPEAQDEELVRYNPEVPIDYVLEVRAGLSDEKGFEVGDRVESEILRAFLQ